MKCPGCQHDFTYYECLKIINPFNHACPSCGAKLTLGRQGVWYTLASAIGGASLAVAMIMLERDYGLSKSAALAAFTLAFTVGAGIGELYCWKNGRFSLREPHTGKNSQAHPTCT